MIGDGGLRILESGLPTTTSFGWINLVLPPFSVSASLPLSLSALSFPFLSRRFFFYFLKSEFVLVFFLFFTFFSFHTERDADINTGKMEGERD